MARPAIENHELPSAVKWERLRADWHGRHGNWELAEQCTTSADWLQNRLNTLLEGQIDATE